MEDVRFWHIAGLDADDEHVRFLGVKWTSLIRARMSGNDMQRMMSWLLHLRHRHDLDDFYPCAGHSQKWMVFAE